METLWSIYLTMIGKKIHMGSWDMREKETNALRYENRVKTVISTQNLMLFGIEDEKWICKNLFQLWMIEIMWGYKKMAKQLDSHTKRYKNLTTVSKMAKKSLISNEFGGIGGMLARI